MTGRYRVVYLNFTPEIEVFHMLFERYLTIFSTTSLKQHTEYLQFHCKFQLDLPINSTWPNCDSITIVTFQARQQVYTKRNPLSECSDRRPRPYRCTAWLTTGMELSQLLCGPSRHDFKFTKAVFHVSSGCSRCHTGNGEKLSNSQVCHLAQLCLAAA